MKRLEIEELFDKKLDILEKKQTLESIINRLKEKRVLIYGAGFTGTALKDILNRYNIDIECFLDIKAKEIKCVLDKKVYRAEEYGESNDLGSVTIILCVNTTREKREQIIKYLKNLGANDIVLYDEIYFSLSSICNANSSIVEKEYYIDNKKKFIDVFDLLDDELSRNTYIKCLFTWMLRSLDEAPSLVNEKQYFPYSINMSRGYSTFVDCGAFIGDTINELLAQEEKVETIVAFEPDRVSFSKLSQYTNNLEVNKVILMPYGVSNESKQLKFEETGNVGSKLSDQGECCIQCMRLDDALKEVKPTFLKMDIEGEEYRAIVGAQSTISEYKPDLAICIYHSIDDYFRIPLLINSWNLGYKFYLRAHAEGAIEVVLYATCK